jgi:hypothetical protein
MHQLHEEEYELLWGASTRDCEMLVMREALVMDVMVMKEALVMREW